MRRTVPSTSGAYGVVIYHGSNASTARPPSALPAMWVGTVRPTNALAHDTWLDESVVAGTGVTVIPMIESWTYAGAWRVVSATVDSNGATISASIVWPDGATGTFTTDTASTSFPGEIDAFHVTYLPSGGTTTTLTQPAVTRDPASGAVTAQPALIVS